MTNKILNDFYAVILAGGSGTRFWPLSREEYPKQFLNITGQKTLLQETIKRITPLVAEKNIFIVTNKMYQEIVEEQLKGLSIPKTNILSEPQGKNTAPAVAWAAAIIQQRNPDAIMGIFPSDHFIVHEKAFLDHLDQAYGLAKKSFLVTMGIVPTRPETGYGYLKTKPIQFDGRTIIMVEKFIEKPFTAKAEQFFKEKVYLWNSGMFVWKASVILKAFQDFLPEVYEAFQKTSPAHIQKIWEHLPDISIDYSILEKSGNVVTIPASDIGWTDLGSWQALFELLPKDKNGNILQGDQITLDTANNLLISTKRLVVTVGLKDCAVIDTTDALLICPLNSSQRVKEIVQILKENNRPERVSHKSRKK